MTRPAQLLTMDNLWHHATLNRVAQVMRPNLESLTAASAPAAHIRLGDALAALSRDIGLTNADFEVLERLTAAHKDTWLNFKVE